VLGGQIVAEIDNVNGGWQWQKGYVYAGSRLLAVQQGSAVYFVHEDPITKSKRVTDMGGVVQSAVELDPYGADTARSMSSAFQPKKFTSYERDANGTDEAMARRYNRWHSRFDQPDPYDGSYDFSDPQSFNRYSYTQGDPVNFVDPSGLDEEVGDGDVVSINQRIPPWVWHGGSGGLNEFGAPNPVDTLGPLKKGFRPPQFPEPTFLHGGTFPYEPHPHCGVNPVTGQPGINAVPSGNFGELRRGIGGDGRFGSRGGHHQGIDIRAPVGTPVHANRAGEVTFSGYVTGYGNVVVIDHAPDAYTLYAHLNAPSELSRGDMVEEGEVIGSAGRTGNAGGRQLSSEDHLHFGFKSSPIALRRGERFNDPVSYLNNPCPP
jgi:RHS repeat-associated protein